MLTGLKGDGFVNEGEIYMDDNATQTTKCMVMLGE